MARARTKTPPFRFKQFTIQQHRSAMKVGFDGILLGAWTDVAGCQRILDVGAGTGLVSLMLAQRTASDDGLGGLPMIDAIDIDAAAAGEATLNVNNSPWCDRVVVMAAAVQDFAQSHEDAYDLLACNPPFFSSGGTRSKSSDAREIARHDASLSFEDLCRAAETMLPRSGRMCVILPSKDVELRLATAQRFGFHCRRRLLTKPLPKKPTHRELIEFRFCPGAVETQTLTIEVQRHQYTDAFRRLARDFYLAF